MTILEAINAYLDSVRLSRSQNTARTYRNALQSFSETLRDNNLDPKDFNVDKLSENTISWFARDLKDMSPSTESLYLTATTGFFEYLLAEQICEVNLPRVRMLIRQRSRRPGKRLPQFPQKSIVDLLNYANNLARFPTENKAQLLRNLRDRAFIITLAETGLRVHEACSLRRGDIDWNEGKAIIVGKGNRQDVIRISTKALLKLKEYLKERSKLDGASNRPLSSLPLFSRHDRGAGKKIKPISTATGRNIVSQRVKEALGVDFVGKITPHSFRHYFVTTVLRGSGGNLKLAQELARHKNIAVTQRYAHISNEELDKGYWDIFES